MCATPAAPAPGESIETTIRKLLARFTSAVNNRDVEAMVSLYAPDAVVLPPNNSAAIGTNAIRDLFKAMLDAGVSDFTAEDTRIEHRVISPSRSAVTRYKLRRKRAARKRIAASTWEPGGGSRMANTA